MAQASKRKLWIALSISLAALLTVLVVLVVVLSRPQQPPEPSGTTEPTLPPPVKNTLGPEDFIYENGYLTCVAAPSRLGVDVSKYQGQIDWQAVKDAGMTFAMIRVAGRGYGEAGSIYDDPTAQTNYEGARAAGLEVGVYFFSQAISAEEARQEARYILEQTAHWELDMPIVYDWERMEGEARTANTDRRTVTDCMLAFCDEVEKAGRTPMVYFNPDHAEGLFYIEEVTQYKFWLAMYTDWMTFPYEVNMWQYTDAGTVPGIGGKVDINLFFPESIKN